MRVAYEIQCIAAREPMTVGPGDRQACSPPHISHVRVRAVATNDVFILHRDDVLAKLDDPEVEVFVDVAGERIVLKGGGRVCSACGHVLLCAPSEDRDALESLPECR